MNIYGLVCENLAACPELRLSGVFKTELTFAPEGLQGKTSIMEVK